MSVSGIEPAARKIASETGSREGEGVRAGPKQKARRPNGFYDRGDSLRTGPVAKGRPLNEVQGRVDGDHHKPGERKRRPNGDLRTGDTVSKRRFGQETRGLKMIRTERRHFSSGT